tara:strand:- start:466 stop:1287 length:822 start_codon:yes stop_codon:yes gene_type:complete
MVRALILLAALLVSAIRGGNANWDSYSAHIMPPNKWSVGIFHPIRYGIKDGLELSSHPGWFFVLPNASFKVPLSGFKSFHTATRISFIYPTPLLNMLSREGIGGIIDPNFAIPPMLGVSGSFLMSKELLEVNSTIKAGLDFGLVFGDLDARSNIDLPIIYHRLEVFHNGWGWHTGLDLDTELLKKVRIFMDIDLRFIPDTAKKGKEKNYTMRSGDYSIEHKMLLIWERSSKFRIMTGYKLVSGDYPYGKQTRLLPYIPLMERWLPLIELQWLR